MSLLIIVVICKYCLQEYGVCGLSDLKNNGSGAYKYAAFIDNELVAFINKKAGVRKFKIVATGGCLRGGLSNVDIAWDTADKMI